MTDRDTDRRTPRHSKRDKKLTRMHAHTESMIGVSLWCRGFGRLQASAALLRMVPGPGTDQQRPSDHQNCRSLPEASPGQNMRGGHWTDMASAEREPITGVWRRSDSPPPYPCKNSSDLYQFQERPLAKVGWTCPPQSTPWRRHCSLHSSASSRPTRLFQALDSAGCSCGCRVPSSDRRWCDCTASSAPTTNVQTRHEHKQSRVRTAVSVTQSSNLLSSTGRRRKCHQRLDKPAAYNIACYWRRRTSASGFVPCSVSLYGTRFETLTG